MMFATWEKIASTCKKDIYEFKVTCSSNWIEDIEAYDKHFKGGGRDRLNAMPI